MEWVESLGPEIFVNKRRRAGGFISNSTSSRNIHPLSYPMVASVLAGALSLLAFASRSFSQGLSLEVENISVSLSVSA